MEVLGAGIGGIAYCGRMPFTHPEAVLACEIVYGAVIGVFFPVGGRAVENVVIPVFLITAKSFCEPAALVSGVVEDIVDVNVYVFLCGLLDEFLEFCLTAILGIDGIVIRNVIGVI